MHRPAGGCPDDLGDHAHHGQQQHGHLRMTQQRGEPWPQRGIAAQLGHETAAPEQAVDLQQHECDQQRRERQQSEHAGQRGVPRQGRKFAERLAGRTTCEHGDHHVERHAQRGQYHQPQASGPPVDAVRSERETARVHGVARRPLERRHAGIAQHAGPRCAAQQQSRVQHERAPHPGPAAERRQPRERGASIGDAGGHEQQEQRQRRGQHRQEHHADTVQREQLVVDGRL